ncbi:probable sodium/potassium/calcium exchanger CG1090 isoform X2 [Onthophagus taurus]|nr:probable sodium/potassium/calcium exchanger CG1090 [Onthophagus taurus]
MEQKNIFILLLLINLLQIDAQRNNGLKNSDGEETKNFAEIQKVLKQIPTPIPLISSTTIPTLSMKGTTKSPLHPNVPITGSPKETKHIHVVPTYRPKRSNCTPPAIEQFPKPLMGPTARKSGGIIIHVLVAIYTFIGLAIVCDEYFVASLDRICEELKLSPDVAGATFMAAGSSAPELATVIIGVFFAKDDIGISGVIGSAVFNIMFVISVCALCTNTVCYLNWWPLVRDCFFYAVSILVMLMTIFNETISWSESLFMLFMYVVYCVVLHYNPQLEAWAQTLPVPCKMRAPEEESGLVSYKTLNEEMKRSSYGSPDKNFEPNETDDLGNLSGAQLNQIANNPPAPLNNQQPPKQPAAQNYYRPKEYDPNKPPVDPLEKPVDGSLYVRFSWAIVYPIHYMAKLTMPDCRTDKYRNWYPFTFFMSMIWISFYSYFMVWMITIIGSTFNIPDTVMGLTFVAAGVSVPDALSSIAVLKEGYGDMAVSNAVGSNVFDILVCLGLPWFIQTAIIKPGSHVNVISKGLTYSTLSLLSTVVFLVGATHLNGWKLDKKLGIILMIWYVVFIIFASMYELNIFGPLNPPECISFY